jgi:hypothetical protein
LPSVRAESAPARRIQTIFFTRDRYARGVETDARARLAKTLRLAARRRSVSDFLRAFGAAGLPAGIVVLIAVVLYERSGPQLSPAAHAAIAAGVAAFSCACALLWHSTAQREPIARRLDRALESGALLATSAELLHRPPAGPGLAELCIRDALRAAERSPAAALFPWPTRRAASALAAALAIYLAAFLPRWGFAGSDPAGIGVRNVSAEARAGESRPQNAKPNDRENEAGERAPETRAMQQQQSVPPPESKPQSDSESGTQQKPPKPEPIGEFQAKTDLVPIDPTAPWRSKREAWVIEIEEARARAAAEAARAPQAAAPAARRTTPNPETIRQWERAAERALAKDNVTDKERGFAKRYFELLQAR